MRLQGNVTDIAKRRANGADVWLSEGNSICHQGVNGITNSYLNSLWLVNRLGIMANANVTVMARQSLIGYNYSLLGNWPVEPIEPNPDYFTTVLFKRLFGDRVLATAATATPAGPPATNITEGGDRARVRARVVLRGSLCVWVCGCGCVGGCVLVCVWVCWCGWVGVCLPPSLVIPFRAISYNNVLFLTKPATGHRPPPPPPKQTTIVFCLLFQRSSQGRAWR